MNPSFDPFVPHRRAKDEVGPARGPKGLGPGKGAKKGLLTTYDATVSGTSRTLARVRRKGLLQRTQRAPISAEGRAAGVQWESFRPGGELQR